MATEKRLIDANALIDALPVVTEDKRITLYGAVADFMITIFAMPTVDAVEVVRCKDCKHYMLWEDSEYKRTCSKSIGLMISDPDDFCSYGERKDDAQ